MSKKEKNSKRHCNAVITLKPEATHLTVRPFKCFIGNIHEHEQAFDMAFNLMAKKFGVFVLKMDLISYYRMSYQGRSRIRVHCFTIKLCQDFIQKFLQISYRRNSMQ